MDTFPMIVSHTSGEGAFHEVPRQSAISVMASSTNEATLTALEMVAARGRCPVAVEVDWTNF